jgi:WD40 repeat protein
MACVFLMLTANLWCQWVPQSHSGPPLNTCRTIQCFDEEIVALALSDRDRLVVASDASRCATFRWPTGKEEKRSSAKRWGDVYKLCPVAGSDRVAIGSIRGSVRLAKILDTDDGSELYKHQSVLTCVTASRDGRMMASGDCDGTIEIADLMSKGKHFGLKAHESAVRCLQFSPDGRTLASGGKDGGVRIWELATAKMRAELKGIDGTVEFIAFASDGRTIAAAGADGVITIWDVASSEMVKKLPVRCGSFRGLSFVPGTQQLIFATGNIGLFGASGGSITIWDWKNAKEIGYRHWLSEAITCIAPSADGETLVAGDSHGHLHFLNLATNPKEPR